MEFEIVRSDDNRIALIECMAVESVERCFANNDGELEWKKAVFCVVMDDEDAVDDYLLFCGGFSGISNLIVGDTFSRADFESYVKQHDDIVDYCPSKDQIRIDGLEMRLIWEDTSDFYIWFTETFES